MQTDMISSLCSHFINFMQKGHQGDMTALKTGQQILELLLLQG